MLCFFGFSDHKIPAKLPVKQKLLGINLSSRLNLGITVALLSLLYIRKCAIPYLDNRIRFKKSILCYNT